MHTIIRFAALSVATAILTSCGDDPQQGGGPPPPDVGVIRVKGQAVPLSRDLVGRLSPEKASDVRARVPGVLQKRTYDEGSDVKEGQVLFVIDPAHLKAAVDAAEAALAQAEATAKNAEVLAARLRSVAKQGYVSRTDFDNAEANERSSAAAVQQARANLETARINLGYAYVRSPIAGRAGQMRVTIGALVGQTEPTLLTTVEQLDPMRVLFDQPASEFLELRSAEAEGKVTLAEPNRARLQILGPGGKPTGETGTLDFSGVVVDPSTGALQLRGTVPNKDRTLLPGLFVNVRLTLGQLNKAYVVPQLAVQRDGQGPYVLVVGPENKVVQKRVTTPMTSGTNWIVTDGLQDGDAVVVSGLQRAMIGSVVNPVAAAEQDKQSAQQASAPPQSQ
jgi:membrane fusion protein, multidrug efflux system